MSGTAKAFCVALVLATLAGIGGGIWSWASPSRGGWHERAGADLLVLDVDHDCPRSFPTFNGIANPGGGSPTVLVPPKPIGGLICRYQQEQGGPLVLYREVRLNRTVASRIASTTDTIKSRAFPNGPISCPAEGGAYALLGFSYTGGRQSVLAWSDTGCQVVWNGNLAASEFSPGFQNFESAVDEAARPGEHG